MINVTPWTLFSSRQFFPLFVTQFLGACNDNIFKNALIIFIVFLVSDSLAISAQFLVAMASGLFILPFFLFSITAGQVADTYRKSTLILYTKLIEFLLIPFAILGFYWHHIGLLMATLFLLGIQASFFGPLKYAILPELLTKKEDLLRGNGFIQAATFIAILIGTIVGAIFIMVPQGKAIISSIMLLLALLGVLSAWCIPPTQYAQFKEKTHCNILQEMRTLLKFVRARPPLLISILGISWFWLFGSTILSILPPFTKIMLKGDETVVTFFLATFSIGIAIGSLICVKISKTRLRSHIIYLSLLGLTLCTMDMALTLHLADKQEKLISISQFLHYPAHYRVIVDALGLAIFGGLYTVPLNTLIQSKTPLTHRARVIALNNIMNALFMICSALGIMGLTSLGMSITQNLWVLGGGCAVVSILLYRHRRHIT